jgi:DNA ligase D-like protein (predicted ligase)
MSETLPLDLEPMLAAVHEKLPAGDDWEYEPKWDGFRTIAHRRGNSVELVSRGARPLSRYFPEVLDAFRRLSPDRVVLDGELIIVGRDGLDFEALQLRLHPAQSRVKLLSESTPALYVAFDVLAIDGQDLRELPLSARREGLERLLEGVEAPLMLTPYTRDPELARRWFDEFEGAGLDGVIAKAWSQPYLPGKRGWVKLKHRRTADCVVLGFRWSSDRKTLGALLLGLYHGDRTLHYVGHTSSFDAATRRELLARLQPLAVDVSQEGRGRMPGGTSRWSRGRETEWQSIRPELVCEVAYEKLQAGNRFRHATGFVRWRPDKPPEACTFDQIASVARVDVDTIFGIHG